MARKHSNNGIGSHALNTNTWRKDTYVIYIYITHIVYTRHKTTRSWGLRVQQGQLLVYKKNSSSMDKSSDPSSVADALQLCRFQHPHDQKSVSNHGVAFSLFIMFIHIFSAFSEWFPSDEFPLFDARFFKHHHKTHPIARCWSGKGEFGDPMGWVRVFLASLWVLKLRPGKTLVIYYIAIENGLVIVDLPVVIFHSS